MLGWWITYAMLDNSVLLTTSDEGLTADEGTSCLDRTLFPMPL